MEAMGRDVGARLAAALWNAVDGTALSRRASGRQDALHGVEGTPLFEDAEDDAQQFPGDDNERLAVGAAVGPEPLVVRAELGVVVHGAPRGHVQALAQVAVPALAELAPAPPCPALALGDVEADEGDPLLGAGARWVERLAQDAGGSGGDPGDRGGEPDGGPLGLVGEDGGLDLALQGFLVPLQRLHERLDPALGGADGEAHAALESAVGLHHLAHRLELVLQGCEEADLVADLHVRGRKMKARRQLLGGDAHMDEGAGVGRVRLRVTVVWNVVALPAYGVHGAP